MDRRVGNTQKMGALFGILAAIGAPVPQPGSISFTLLSGLNSLKQRVTRALLAVLLGFSWMTVLLKVCVAEPPLQCTDTTLALLTPLTLLPQGCSPTCWDSRARRTETTAQ